MMAVLVFCDILQSRAGSKIKHAGRSGRWGAPLQRTVRGQVLAIAPTASPLLLCLET